MIYYGGEPTNPILTMNTLIITIRDKHYNITRRKNGAMEVTIFTIKDEKAHKEGKTDISPEEVKELINEFLTQ